MQPPIGPGFQSFCDTSVGARCSISISTILLYQVAVALSKLESVRSATLACWHVESWTCYDDVTYIEKGGNEMSLYDISVKTISGEEKTLADYKGKVLLIVNTASQCGLTPQYKGLQELHERFHDKGLVVLGFPCNQFAGQEPGTEEEIVAFCDRNYGVTFPLFAKIDVNGPNTHPLYQFLKSNAPDGENQDIEWNFAKFLVDQDGKVAKRIGARVQPEDITSDIEALL